MALRQTFSASVTLDAAGGGTASIVARGDLAVEHTRVFTSTGLNVPTATLYLNGKQFEGSDVGSNDQSDTRHLMLAGDQLDCVWAGGDAGARATIYVRGIEYPAGQGLAAVT
jgi:hypothetical protein